MVTANGFWDDVSRGGQPVGQNRALEIWSELNKASNMLKRHLDVQVMSGQLVHNSFLIEQACPYSLVYSEIHTKTEMMGAKVDESIDDVPLMLVHNKSKWLVTDEPCAENMPICREIFAALQVIKSGQGSPAPLLALAQRFENGDGVPKNTLIAQRWKERAKAHGSGEPGMLDEMMKRFGG